MIPICCRHFVDANNVYHHWCQECVLDLVKHLKDKEEATHKSTVQALVEVFEEQMNELKLEQVDKDFERTITFQECLNELADVKDELKRTEHDLKLSQDDIAHLSIEVHRLEGMVETWQTLYQESQRYTDPIR